MASTLAQLYANFSLTLTEAMPDPAGMRKKETLALAVLHPGTGMHMHVQPRVPVKQQSS